MTPRYAQVVVILNKRGITEFPYYYFKDCHKLKYVQMPNDIHAIGDHAFQNYKNLKSIVPPKKLCPIGECCFHKCLKLKFIKLLKSAHHVQKGAFANCSNLEYVTLSKI